MCGAITVAADGREIIDGEQGKLLFFMKNPLFL